MTKRSVSKKIVLSDIQEWPIVKMKLGELNPAPYNPRIGDIPNKLDESLKQFGILEPIVINGINNVIIGGHKRYEVLVGEAKREYGDKWSEVSVSVCVAQLSLSQERAANLALNKIGSDSDMWDDTKLSELFNSDEFDDFDLSVTGFDTDDIDRLLNLSDNKSRPVSNPPDEFQEVNEDIKTDHECPKCGFRWSGGE